jgi:hypothetical protein
MSAFWVKPPLDKSIAASAGAFVGRLTNDWSGHAGRLRWAKEGFDDVDKAASLGSRTARRSTSSLGPIGLAAALTLLLGVDCASEEALWTHPLLAAIRKS